MTAPYYQDEWVTLYHGDCREITEWLAADVLVMDPPYGREWQQGAINGHGQHRPGRGSATSAGRKGIEGDAGTGLRDEVLGMWGARPGVVFGDLMLAPPPRTKLVLPYQKPPDAGVRGAIGGFRRDVEAIYLIGPWPSGLGGRSSVITTRALSVGGPAGMSARYGHSHAKPVDVMETLIDACPDGVVADPTAGAGSTLIAARNLGRPTIAVELEERYCERIALRFAQGALVYDR